MNDPRNEMQQALKAAMVAKDAERRDVIRMALNAIKQVEVDERRTLSAEEAMAVLQREAKTRREAIAEAEKAGRGATTEVEKQRLAILESFMPRQMTREEIEAQVRQAIDETGASSPKDMGKVMGVLMPRVRGQADGKLVNDVVREMLSS